MGVRIGLAFFLDIGMSEIYNATISWLRFSQFDSPHPGKELYLYQVKAVIAFLRDVGEL